MWFIVGRAKGLDCVMGSFSGRQLASIYIGLLVAFVLILLVVGRTPSGTWTLRNLWTGQEMVCDYAAADFPILTEPTKCLTQPISASLLKPFFQRAD
jgi:hypothetical protein